MSDEISKIAAYRNERVKFAIGAVLMSDDEYARNELGSIIPNAVCDPDHREFFDRVRAGTASMQAAIDMRKDVEYVGYQSGFDLQDVPVSGRNLPLYIGEINKAHNQILTFELSREAAMAAMKGNLDEARECAQAIEELVKPKTQPKPRFQIRTAADALQPQPPVEYIVDGLIATRTVNVIYGEPGSKKTYSMISLAVCAAGGLPWLGFKTNPCQVLIVDEESGNGRLLRRLGAALRGEELGENTPVQFVSLAGFKMSDPTGRDDLKNLISKTRSQLVIIDALADVMDGDENAKQDVQPVFTALRSIAEDTGAAVVIIHHSNKAGGYRGSSAIKGAVDTMIEVTSEDGSNSITFQSIKNRDGERQTWGAVATWKNSSQDNETFTLRPYTAERKEHYSKAESYVLRFLAEHGASAINAIMGGADACSEQAARQAVYSLTNKGKIYRTNPSQNNHIPAIYDLVKESGHVLP